MQVGGKGGLAQEAGCNELLAAFIRLPPASKQNYANLSVR